MPTVPLEVARDHPAFEGHFPDHPIVPAVVLLAEALAAIEAATAVPPQAWQVSQAKFLDGVAPGTALVLEHEALGSGGVRFEIRSATGVVASGQLARRGDA